MVIGTMFLGKVHKVNEQFVTSKFVIIGVPLFPVESMFVIKDLGSQKQGFTCPVNGTSVGIGYGRFFSAVIGFISLLAGFAIAHNPFAMGIGLLLIGLWIWLQFFAGKPSKEDTLKRTMLGIVLGVNAFPEWLPQNVCTRFAGQLQQTYETIRENYGGANWQDIVKQRRKINQYMLPNPQNDMLLQNCWEQVLMAYSLEQTNVS
jgi:hypothetical protein